MKSKYYQICLLLDQLGPLNSRLDVIHEIIREPDFQYKKGEGGDVVLSQFLRSSYWLDRELFDESYLYKKKKQNLLPIQNDHLKMVDIGAELLHKGFPIKYNPQEYVDHGPDQLGTYVKTFVNQCHKKYTFLYERQDIKQITQSENQFL